MPHRPLSSGPWLAINRAVYAVYYRLRHGSARRAGRRPPATPLGTRDDGRRRVLWVAWGRIGDVALSTGIVKHLRSAFPGREIVFAGRAEVRPVVAPLIDEFVPLEPGGATLAARLDHAWDCILGDVHLFYGGVFALRGLLEALPAPHKLVYEGYHLGPGLAPVREYPEGFRIVPARPRPAAPADDLGAMHVLHDHAHYLGAVLAACGGGAVPADVRPVVPPPPAHVLGRFDLVPGTYVAWQPVSNNPKKDYPLARWRHVLRAFPHERFVALGTAREGARLHGLDAPNVRVLCGRTDVEEALAVLAGARLHLGLDSGLTHLATLLGRPTVCVAQNMNLGYFFPYPPEYGFTNLRTVFHPDYLACAGCFMTCRWESIAATWTRGALCLRELPPALVVRAVEEALQDRAAAAD